MSRFLTVRLVVIVSAAFWLFAMYGCNGSDAPAPIQGDVKKADPSAKSNKPGGAGGAMKPNPND